ncbi:hypothetical protein D3C81_1133050 [compost metagenome]
MKLSCPNRISDPFGFDQIRFVSKLKASVYLLTNQAERRTCLKLGGVKKLFEKSFKFVATLLRWQIAQVVQPLLQSIKDCALINDRCRSERILYHLGALSW